MVQLEGTCGSRERPHAWCGGSRVLQESGAAWQWPGRDQGLKNWVMGTVSKGGGGMRRGSRRRLETPSVCPQVMGGEDSGRVAGPGEGPRGCWEATFVLRWGLASVAALSHFFKQEARLPSPHRSSAPGRSSGHQSLL